ncbi:MAG TPA: hypothetical protein VNQ14_04415, partial [Woeseiaceae bacterium]|nr:hypothetical protein [Woeseiaceae bacterium]
LKLLLAGPEDVVHATGDYEVWEIDEATIRPLDILEEALIMAMPLSALHGPGEDCVASAEVAPAASDGTQRPFADLRSKISRGDDGEESGNPE